VGNKVIFRNGLIGHFKNVLKVRVWIGFIRVRVYYPGTVYLSSTGLLRMS